jgi:hypothetical protein
MSGKSQMQGGKNWILHEIDKRKSGSSETLIGWKSGKTTYVPLWNLMEGARLRTQARWHYSFIRIFLS